MKIAKFLSLSGLLAMTVALIYGFSIGDFFNDGKILLDNPWGIVSLVDLYAGFTLFSIWIAYREKNLIVSLIWIVMMMVLGFFTGSLYVVINLYNSNGDMKKFFLGHRA